VRCAEGVGHDALAQFIEPDLRWIAAEVNQAEVITIPDFSQWRRDKGAARTWRGAGGRGYILERRVFDRALAERAAQAGAEVRVKTAATALLMEDRRVRGIEIRRSDFLPPSTGSGQALTGTSRGPDCNAGTVEVEAQVVIAADGIEAQVGRWAGLDLQLPLKDTMVCVQYLLAGIEVDPTCTRYTLCHELAPGGYAWVFPKGEGKANVGLGVQADLWKDVLARSRPGPAARGENAAGRGAVLDLLHRFIESDPRLVRGYPVTLIAGNVPVALPPSRLVADGLMLAGDAARQVDPLTGGGIINAMAAGQLAAEVAVAAIAAGDTSAASLARYQEMWQGSVGRKMERNYRLREKFLPAQRADERFMRAFALAIS
jgi:digeranylgeranylglycerophospholipid reductase